MALEATNAIPGTNSLGDTNAPGAAAAIAAHFHLPEWLAILLVALLVVIIAPGLYYSMIVLGRQLKRKHGVRLGVLYHAFSLGFAIFLPAVLLLPDWAIIHHIGAATVIFGSVFIISLVDRYVWELYFKQIQNIDVPKFLPEV